MGKSRRGSTRASRSGSSFARNQAELARALEVSRKTISLYVRDPRWPFAKVGPWEIRLVREWRSRTLDRDPNSKAEGSVPRGTALGEAKLAGQIKLLRAKIDELEQRIAIRAGEYLPRRDVELARAQTAASVKTTLKRTAHALRTRLADIDDPREIEKTLLRAFRALCNHAFGGNVNADDRATRRH